MTLEMVACDLCGGKAFKPVFPGTISDPNTNPASYFSSSRKNAGYLPIVQCVGCGLVMSNPRDDAATIQQVYASLSDPVYDAEDANRQRTARAYLHFIQRFSPPPGFLLDLGCATGVFACEAQAKGWQVTGLEPSTWSLNQARNRCNTVRWVNNLLERANFPPAHFQIITLWDVLEHVNSPTEVMQLVHNWLAPGGWVFLNLPNNASLTARLTGARWVLLLREHFWYFSPATMRQLFEKTGFTLIHTQPNYVRFSFANIATRLSQYTGWMGQLGRRMIKVQRLQNWTFTFPMGEMNVVAQSKPKIE